MQYFLYILSIPFLYFNYKIIISDLKNKIIPNKYLGYLLLLIPFYYIYIFFSFPEVNYLLFLLQIFLTFLVSFILYYFGIWAAGDAKYLLVLALFIPYIGIVPFIGNIALVTLIYLFGYFLYFYLYKIVFNKQYRQSLWGNIKYDLSERWKVHKSNKGGNTKKIIFKFLVIFLLIFVSIRLVRLYLFKNINPLLTSPQGRGTFWIDFIEKYNIYLIFIFIGLFIGGLYLFRILINKIKIIISEKFKLDLNYVGNILLAILSIFLINFIAFEYFKNPYEIKNYLFRIFTLYLALYLIFKILKGAYKITFGIAEYYTKEIKLLNNNDIIDITDFNKKIMSNLENDKSLLNYYNIENDTNIVLNNEKIKKIKSIIRVINKKDIKFYGGKSIIKNFKCIKTFSFGVYIFIGFVLTFFLSNNLMKIFINKILLILKNIIN